MYILWNLLVRIERSFGWSSGLLLFGQIELYRFGHGFLVYAESERFKLAVTDMDGFDHAYSLVLFVHFDLHDGFRFVVEFRADVTTGMFIILVLMQVSMDMDLPEQESFPSQLSNPNTVNSDCPQNSHLNKYDSILVELKKKEIERQVEIMDAIREYVTVKTAPYLSKEDIATLITNIEYMAYDQPESYKPIRSNIDNPLRSPGLRHLAWNVGERLGVPLAKRAVFIKKSFPYELVNATLEYLRLNLRDNVPSQIPIDVPDKGDYRFHLDVDNDDSQ